jgi:anaphase-promoting complex subunit 2
LRDEKLIMPPQLQEEFAEYASEYSKIKRGRKLTWMDHLGTVEVEIELMDRRLSVEVTPIQAAVLYAFEGHGATYTFYRTDSEQLTVDQLCRLTGANAVSVKRAVLYWILQGVLKEVAPDAFHVLEYAETASPNQGIAISDTG